MKCLLYALLLWPCLCFPGEVRIAVPYARATLPNGLTLILHEDHSTPTISVNLYYHVGSAREKPGRTGFAHLFEHIMFEGSAHVPEGKFDEWLEAAGGNNNGSTTPDRTNYYEDVPSNALELPLFLESDRMGYLLPAMSEAKVDGQRDVVKNERRQSHENRPYGMDSIILMEQAYPEGHPYHWPTIGYMPDLTAASYNDVVAFFKTYYVPNNASLVVAGDIDLAKTLARVQHWFSDVPPGKPIPPLNPPTAVLTAEKRLLYEDRVQLPRLYLAWITPAAYHPGDAEMDMLSNVLAGGKTSRLHKRLVYELQIAQDVMASQQTGQLSSLFAIVATARSGHTLAELEKVIQEEINHLKTDGPTPRETARAVNQFEASFLARLEGIAAKADLLNNYFMLTGNPDYFNEDLARYRAVDPDDIRAAAQSYLPDHARVVLSIVPQGKKDLASGECTEIKQP